MDAVNILELSDVHLGSADEAENYRTRLETDLIKELGVTKLHYVVISGDIGNRAAVEEYAAAQVLFEPLFDRFQVDKENVVMAPGNHDVDWNASAAAYELIPHFRAPKSLVAGTYVDAGAAGVAVRNDLLYPHRFASFARFYQDLLGQPYPLDLNDQGILHLYPSHKILFLSLNSCWQLDHIFPKRSGINPTAVSRALSKLARGDYDRWVKFAVWHHPIAGPEAMNDNFLETLAVHGFSVGMHGDIHRAIEGTYRYDKRRHIHVIGAGTFGAPAKQQTTGIPLQYNLLRLDPMRKQVIVESRKKEAPEGAWSADARWGDKNNPQPRYEIKLR